MPVHRVSMEDLAGGPRSSAWQCGGEIPNTAAKWRGSGGCGRGFSRSDRRGVDRALR